MTVGDSTLRLLEEGLRHHVLGDDESAAACWKEILRRDPENEKARRLLGMIAGSRRRTPERSAGAAERPRRQEPPAILREGKAPAPVRVAEGEGGEEIETLMKGAEDLFGLGDFSGSLELVEKVLDKVPGHPRALDYLGKNRKTLTHLYESKLGSVGAKPMVALRPDEILWLNIDHRAGFVLSQIDGNLTVDELYALSGMSRMETARILAQLLEDGVIRID